MGRQDVRVVADAEYRRVRVTRMQRQSRGHCRGRGRCSNEGQKLGRIDRCPKGRKGAQERMH